MAGTVEKDLEIVVLLHMTDAPGGRYRADGPYSGEEFRKRYLEPAFNNADVVEVILDGTYGLPPGFLEEAFGGMARLLGSEQLKRRLRLVCLEDSSVIFDIWSMIFKACNKGV